MLRKKNILIVFGTRPEAIKMVPVVKAMEKIPALQPIIVSTGQHREMLQPVLKRFGVKVDFEMALMEPDQSLYRLSVKTIAAFEDVIEKSKPAMILVQGDTTTAFIGALCAFYGKIPVGHVEAGLRTGKKHFPFPEEINRRLITAIADLNFAPTEITKENLLREGVDPERVFVTGNTGIDALLLAAKLDEAPVSPKVNPVKKRLVLVTIHRRESFGDVMRGIFFAMRDIAMKYGDVEMVYPVHLNPNVKKLAYAVLGKVPNIHLVEPMDYFHFVYLMKRSFLILTDSGGIQEEAPTLGIPVLVIRNETERPEAVASGAARLIGTSREKITAETSRVLDNKDERGKFLCACNPFGDGGAARRIVRHVSDYLTLGPSRKRITTQGKILSLPFSNKGKGRG